MINSEDTKIIKELVISSLGLAIGGDYWEALQETQPIVEKAFNIVIKEMEECKI